MPRKAVSEIVLQPGEYFVGDRRHRVRTLLGSCISITLWSETLRIGAMSHCLLSRRAAGAGPGTGIPLDGRYVEEAVVLMLEALGRRGAQRSLLQAKLFGGGQMFPDQFEGAASIGVSNGESARQLLQRSGIPVAAECLYGPGHRHIIFDIASGEVWVRYTRNTATAAMGGRSSK